MLESIFTYQKWSRDIRYYSSMMLKPNRPIIQMSLGAMIDWMIYNAPNYIVKFQKEYDKTYKLGSKK